MARNRVRRVAKDSVRLADQAYRVIRRVRHPHTGRHHRARVARSDHRGSPVRRDRRSRRRTRGDRGHRHPHRGRVPRRPESALPVPDRA
jgi:hypothetical protein